MILDAKTYEDNHGMKGIPTDIPQREELELSVILTEEDRQRQEEEDEQTRKDNVRKRKKRRVRHLLASLNSLSAAFLAALSVAKRQIAILQDVHCLFLTSYEKKTKDYRQGYPLRQKPYHTNTTPILTPLENSQQMWPNSLDAIEEVVRQRECFINKIKELVENIEIRRKFVNPHN